VLAGATGEFQTAIDHLQEGLDIAHLEGRNKGFVCLVALGQVHTTLSDYEVAADFFQEAAGLSQGHNPGWRMEFRIGRGKLALHIGDYAGAQLHYEEGLTLARRSGDHLHSAKALLGLGRTVLRQDDEPGARRHLLEALQDGLHIGFAPVLLDTVVAVAELLVLDGDLGYAAQLAALVMEHPAATAETKREANTLFTQVMQELPQGAPILAMAGSAGNELEPVAETLVAELARSNEMTAQTAPSSTPTRLPSVTSGRK
jgi:tetratricopeptide (TPR) repeat protein